MSNTWPPMQQWEQQLPKEEPMRCLAHTKLYKRHNDRLEARLDQDRHLGRFPGGQAEEFASPQRQELGEVLARLRAHLKR